jgi:membrane-associated phospholipid phosphatase
MEDVRPAPLRARFTPLQLAIVGLAVAFALLAALVAAGRLSGIDRYAVAHWMPGLDPSEARRSVPEPAGIFRPFKLGTGWWQGLLEVGMYPASVLVSFVVFGVGSAVLWRRGARVAAVVWAATWFVANGLEVLVKAAVTKPALYREDDGVTYHVKIFDHSFPSGHAMRAVLVAMLAAYVWRRLGRVAAVWLVLMPVFLVASSWHVPSDIAGGLVFGLLVVLTSSAVIGAVAARRA